MTHEQQCHARSCFLTLTYSDEHLPQHGQLIKRDLQLFFKRLRKVVGPFRYVACGEYGELRRRPHFHVALFGHDFTADRLLVGVGVKGDHLYESPTISPVWPYGLHRIGSLTFESAAYIARYITKRIQGPGASVMPLALTDDGEIVYPNPEFLLCSRRPGIGHDWFLKYGRTDVLPHGRVITQQGTPAPVPRFYKNKLKAGNMHTPASLALKQLTEKHFATNFNHSENKPERRAARTIYANARTGAFKRDTKG